MNSSQNSTFDQDVGKVSIFVNGREYPLSSTGWVTFTAYAQIFGIKGVNRINNWITRGVVSKENILEVPELNLRLIKAIPYHRRGNRV